ncbi:hypothetical protein [Sphingomicrobium astaxanthinifaciens]|uniref:hypothetical protein n=1 Tax=Sphingomicrobium astaxanthinifaciens TaxID=1227949 RepID=UPI001FCB0743|nr:hypothetical protein [Sphingomicrobium astaxanthinifaciens]MCJ7421649.1 hypothetical protein [Sphingomicrobium astaxanthinifaciens]
MMRPFIPRAPIIMGAISGSFLGSLALVVIALVAGGRIDPAMLVPLLLLTGALVPVAAFAIVLFGYPAANAVGSAWREKWVWVAALLMGALAGWMTRIALMAVIAGGSFGMAGDWPVDPGPVYGASVGLCFWLFERDWRLRDAARRAAEGPGEALPTAEDFARLP